MLVHVSNGSYVFSGPLTGGSGAIYHGSHLARGPTLSIVQNTLIEQSP